MTMEIRDDFEPTAAQLALQEGDPVWCLRDDRSRTRHSVKYGPPYRNPAGTWVVHLTGIAGYYALQRVTPRAVTLATLLADCQNQRVLIADLFADAAEWNATRPDTPIEADPDGMMARMDAALVRTIAQIEARIADGQR